MTYEERAREALQAMGGQAADDTAEVAILVAALKKLKDDIIEHLGCACEHAACPIRLSTLRLSHQLDMELVSSKSEPS